MSWHSILLFLSRACHLHDLQIYRMPPPSVIIIAAPQTITQDRLRLHTLALSTMVSIANSEMYACIQSMLEIAIATLRARNASLQGLLQVYELSASQSVKAINFLQRRNAHIATRNMNENVSLSQALSDQAEIIPLPTIVFLRNTTYTYDSRSKATWS